MEGFTDVAWSTCVHPNFASRWWFERMVWLPKRLKDCLDDYIPEHLRDTIATEENGSTIKEIRSF